MMDPNATVDLIEQALRDHDYAAARGRILDLVNWLARGGFEPDWKRLTLRARKFFKRQHYGWVING